MCKRVSVALIITMSLSAAVKIEKTQYRGWPNCYRISNGEVELVVTTDVGPRIIRYSFVGGQNMFKEFDEQMGKHGEPSWQARGGVFQKQIARRKKFLESELAREEQTLRSILEEVGHPHHEAAWMVGLMIEQFKTELKWLHKVARELPLRAAANNPAYAGTGE